MASEMEFETLMARFEQVPPDFPRRKLVAKGLQPKFSTVAFNRSYYAPGCGPREVVETWETFEEIAAQLVETTSNHKLVKKHPAHRSAMLAALFERLLTVEDCDEMRWVGRRAAQLLRCEVPQTAKLRPPKELPAPMNAWHVRPSQCGNPKSPNNKRHENPR